jgi:succinate dehydrogenase/fumarate reductase cytochrome b subunit (b558 family)
MAVTSRRLLSLSGIALSLFFLLHLTVNARALRGGASFARTVDGLHRIPVIPLCEWLLILVPLVIHTTLGLWLVATRRRLVEPSPYPEKLGTAVRVAGIVSAAFIAWHLFQLRFRTLGVRLDGGELATLLAAELSSTWHGMPLRGATYLVGTACVTFHFAAGTWAFFATTRVCKEPRTRRWAAWAAGTMGAAVWVLLSNIVVFHATGSRLLGAPADDDDPSGRAPCPVDTAVGR